MQTTYISFIALLCRRHLKNAGAASQQRSSSLNSQEEHLCFEAQTRKSIRLTTFAQDPKRVKLAEECMSAEERFSFAEYFCVQLRRHSLLRSSRTKVRERRRAERERFELSRHITASTRFPSVLFQPLRHLSFISN